MVELIYDSKDPNEKITSGAPQLSSFLKLPSLNSCSEQVPVNYRLWYLTISFWPLTQKTFKLSNQSLKKNQIQKSKINPTILNYPHFVYM